MTRATVPRVDSAELVDRLEPVRCALLADAHDEADRLLTAARTHAREVVDRAEQDVADAVADAVRRRTIASRAHADQIRARARADAHAEQLAARERNLQELRRAVRDAALRLRHDRRYPALLDDLQVMARAQLGPDARIERDPTPVGGIVATAGRRRVDYSLPALADRAIAAHPEVESLWS
jgi:vacuolar-type H+-ATPase subunit H